MTDKGRILKFPDAAAIDAEAAAWVARFDAGDVSAKDQAAFQEWLNRSALHREAIAEYGNLWSEFDALRLLTSTGEAGREAGARDIRAAVPKRARPWLAACAAAVIAVAGGMVLVHPRPLDFAKSGKHPPANTGRIVLLTPKPLDLAKSENLPPANVGGLVLVHSKPQDLAKSENQPHARLFYETAIGAQRNVTLADGSSVILNTNSRLDVDFSGNRRDVHLVRGEAYFEVVHDKTRPFTVYADNYVVRDIGTAFDVQLSKTGLVEVGVTKGSVEVKPASDGHVSGAAKSLGVLAAGYDIVLGEKVERAEAVSNAELVRKLAWRQGELIYAGQPLGEVLADISRYSDIKIEVADPALENLPVGGAFKTDQIEAIFAALENNFGLHAEWIDPQHVRFTSSREKSTSRG
jgi:transmembrane sensor